MKGNKYIVYDKYAEMIINSKIHGEVKILIDKEDILKCRQYTWHFAKSKDRGYAQCKVNNRNVKLHRYLMEEYNRELLIDHINRNTLDNRKCNLRIADYQKNSFNRGIRSDNTTGYIGIDYNKVTNKWRAKIRYNNIDIHLGYFKDINEALINRRIAEQILFGEYSPNEFIENVEDDLLSKSKGNVINRIENKIA